MSNGPLEQELGCCNCSHCQSFIMAMLQRIEDLEEAIGDLQGTREITDIPLTDELIAKEVEYSQEINAGEVFDIPQPMSYAEYQRLEGEEPYYSRAQEQADIANAAYYDEVAQQERAAWERFNTRFENLPEQGGYQR